jgi:hypothetical protein
MTNIISPIAGRRADFFRTTLRTLTQVFPEVYVFMLGGNPEESTNLILVCPAMARGFSADEVRELGTVHGVAVLTERLVAPGEYEDAVREALVLTDEHAPVEVLVANQ